MLCSRNRRHWFNYYHSQEPGKRVLLERILRVDIACAQFSGELGAYSRQRYGYCQSIAGVLDQVALDSGIVKKLKDPVFNYDPSLAKGTEFSAGFYERLGENVPHRMSAEQEEGLEESDALCRYHESDGRTLFDLCRPRLLMKTTLMFLVVS